MDYSESAAQTVTHLDESLWRAWGERDRMKKRRTPGTPIVVLKCVCIAVLLAGVILWTDAPRFAFPLRAVVAGGSALVAWQAASLARYGFAAAFALLFLLFNPLLPVLSLSGSWEVGVLVVTIGVFASSLMWLRSGRVRSTFL
jgi:hypothetical protein